MTIWRKSTHSGGGDEGGSCVELARLDDAVVGVRDSTDTTLPHLEFTADQMRGLQARIRRGELHLP